MIVVPEKKAVLVPFTEDEQVTTVIPTSKRVVWDEKYFVAIPHRPDETRVLRNLGYDVPDPMPQYYEWPGRYKPFEAQIKTASFAAMNSRCFILNSMGTGKTLASLWAFDYLRKTKQVHRALVVCPLSTMERTWSDSVFQTFPYMDTAVLHGSKDRRLKLLKQDADIYIINIDGVKTIAEAMKDRPDIDLIVIDELALVRNQKTDRWKYLNELCNKQHPRRVWGMTGSPTPNAPTDAWAQIRLITPDNKDCPKYFGRFRDNVMQQLSQFKWKPKDNALDQVHRLMQPAIRFKLDDCVDLPPQMIVTRDVELTDDQAKAYREVFTKLKTEHAEGQIIASNEAIKASKLVQIACGVAYSATGGNVVIPATHRIEELKNIIGESEGKVIVFVPLTGALEYVADALRDDWSLEIVNGSTSKDERDRIFGEFQNRTDPHVLVANPATMSHGLTLTAATTICWFAPVWSSEIFEQACARVRRPGQTRTTVIVQISGTEIERKMYKRLQEKTSMQNLLLELMEEGSV